MQRGRMQAKVYEWVFALSEMKTLIKRQKPKLQKKNLSSVYVIGTTCFN